MVGTTRRLLRRNAQTHLTNLLTKLHSGDISELMLQLSDREQIALFTLLMKHDRKLSAETLSDLGEERSVDILQQFSREEIAKMLQELETDDAAFFISTLPDQIAQDVLEKMSVEESTEVQGLMQYDEQTAGRIMTPNVFALRDEVSVGEAIHAIQTTEDLEMVFYLYIVDERKQLVGVTSLRQLLMVSPSTLLKKIMSGEIISVFTETDQEEVARQVALYDLLAIPVVDHDNELLGVITVDDVIDVINKEATEDIFHLAGLEADDHIHTSPWTSVRKRLPWLIINLFTLLIAVQVVALYESTIARLTVLAVFLPVVAGLGGNCGTQTLTVIVRGLAFGDVSWERSKAALRKEILVGLANGAAIGILAGLAAYIWKGQFIVGLALGSAIIINLLVAGLFGTLLPLLVQKANIDPAIASGILLTTITDVIGFFSFLGLAALLLHYLPTA